MSIFWNSSPEGCLPCAG